MRFVRFLFRTLVPNRFFGAGWIFVLCAFVSGLIWIRATTTVEHYRAQFHKRFPVILSSDGETLITEDNYKTLFSDEPSSQSDAPAKGSKKSSDLTPLVLEEEPPTIDEIRDLLARRAAESDSMRAHLDVQTAEIVKLDDECRQLKEEEKRLSAAVLSEEEWDEIRYGGLSGDALKARKLMLAGRYEEAWELYNSPDYDPGVGY